MNHRVSRLVSEVNNIFCSQWDIFLAASAIDAFTSSALTIAVIGMPGCFKIFLFFLAILMAWVLISADFFSVFILHGS
jgi:hypothetical protein